VWQVVRYRGAGPTSDETETVDGDAELLQRGDDRGSAVGGRAGFVCMHRELLGEQSGGEGVSALNIEPTISCRVATPPSRSPVPSGATPRLGEAHLDPRGGKVRELGGREHGRIVGGPAGERAIAVVHGERSGPTSPAQVAQRPTAPWRCVSNLESSPTTPGTR
jgi:hypothetical protein